MVWQIIGEEYVRPGADWLRKLRKKKSVKKKADEEDKHYKKYRVAVRRGKEKRHIGVVKRDVSGRVEWVEIAKQVNADLLNRITDTLARITTEGVYGVEVEPVFEEDKVLVVDTNLGLEHALGIARSGYETYYAVVHADPYPRMNDEICGYGFEEIKKIWDWGEGLEEGCNVIVFTDSGFGYLADWFRSKGYAVFGSDAVTERLELDRVYARRVFEKLGIAVPEGKVVRGVKGVMQAITEADGKVFVKINRVRGDVETFATDDPYEAEVILSRGAFRILGDDVMFVVEKKCEGIEVGVDTWFNGNNFLGVVAETIELKGCGNLTKFVSIEDSIWYDVLMKLEPYLRRNGYRGMFCMEGFWDGDKITVIDPCPRMPYICSYAYPKVLEEYGNLIVSVASGEDAEVKPIGKYSVQIGVYTDDPNTWRIIRYERDDAEWIAYRRVIKKDGKIWFVPGDYVVAVAVSVSDDLNNAFREAIERAEAVSTSNIYTQGREFYAYVRQVIEKARDLGYEI